MSKVLAYVKSTEAAEKNALNDWGTGRLAANSKGYWQATFVTRGYFYYTETS